MSIKYLITAKLLSMIYASNSNNIFLPGNMGGGRLQEGSACSTGEEVEQINSYMSRCGNTTKYMLSESESQ